MNLINWVRNPALMWSFSTQRVGLSRDLFYAPSREHAQAAIIHHMRMMFGEELDELGWERNEEYNADVLVEYTDGQSQGDFGYLKLVNDQIKTLNEVMDNYVELTEEEKQKKKQRMEEIRKMYKQMTPTSDPEDYYAYPRQSSFYPEE
jgi:hemerythrin superfamily protein